MSTGPKQDPREGDVRIAIGDLLRAEWRAHPAMGYDPKLPEGDGKHLDITLGTYSEDNAVPQLAIRDVSEIPEGGSGYSAIKADGSGPIQTFMGRKDINVFVGAKGDLAGDEHPQLAARQIGEEARSIIHATTSNKGGIMDSATGELLATDLACSKPRVGVDPDLPEAEFLARQEVTYQLSENPPQR